MKAYQLKFEAIGTRWELQATHSLSTDEWSAVYAQIRRRVESFDKAYSRFRADSLVTKWSQQAGHHPLPPDGYKLMRFYDKLYQASGGLVTPLIGQAMVAAGYDANYSFKPQPLTPPPAWQEIIRYGRDFIELSRPALLDFGAAGKGYLIDIVGDILSVAGVESYLINAGGDILYKPLEQSVVTVGLENPVDTTEAIGIVRLSGGSLCASSGAKRQWSGYHHIIDPQALGSPRQTLAAWATADDAMTADGLATALMLVPASRLRPHFQFSGAVLSSDMSLTYDQDLAIELFKSTKENHDIH